MYDVNEAINGLYGKVFDETGMQVQGTEEFELTSEFEKVEKKVPGKFYTAHKVVGGKISGKVKITKVDTRLQKKITDSPTAKYNYIGKLDDPDARGAEAVLIKGVSFNGSQLLAFKLGELGEVELEFTADDFSYTEYID